MIRAGATVLFLAAAFAAPQAHACAGCSNPNLPTARAARLADSKQLSVALAVTATAVNFVHSTQCPDLGPICQVRDEPGQLHDQMLYTTEFRPIVEFGFDDRFGIEGQLPVRLTRTTIRFRHLDGAFFSPDYENIHHRNETLAGLGDLSLSGRARGKLLDIDWTARVGLSFPTGGTAPDPFALAELGLPHQHIQFGTGTFNPIASLEVSRTWGAFRLIAQGQTQLSLYANRHGYQAGNRFAGGLMGELTVIEKLRLGLAADVLNEQPERWGGEIQSDGNIGRTDVLVGGSVAYAFRAVSVGLAVKVPVYQTLIIPEHTHGDEPGQLTYPAVISLTVAMDFEFAQKPQAHKR